MRTSALWACAILLAVPRQAEAQELRQPSPALEAAMGAGDPVSSASLAATEVESCIAKAGPQPNTEALEPCALLLMVAAQLAQQAGETVDALRFGEAATFVARETFGEDTDIEAYARLARGQALLELGRNDDAEAELEPALAIARQLFEADSRELIPFLGALALARFTRNDPASARALYEEALPIEADPLFAADLRVNYARVLYVLGDTEASLDQARSAAGAFAELLGETSNKTIEARTVVANALTRLERADEAIGLLTPLIAQLEGRSEVEWLLADALRMKAVALIEKSEFAAAEELLERVTSMVDRVYGPDSGMQSQIAALLATVRKGADAQVAGQGEFPVPPSFWEHFYAGRFTEAIALLDPVGKACIAANSPDTIDPAKLGPCATLVALAGLTYSSLNELERGRSFAELAVAIAEASFADPSPELGLALFVRGAVLQQGGRVQESIAPLERSMGMLEDQPDTRFAPMQLLAAAYLQAGEYERSLALIRAATTLDIPPLMRLNFTDIEAQALASLGRIDEAERLVRDVIAGNPEVLPTTRLKLQQALGQVLTAGRRYDEAIAVLEALLPQMRATFGEHPITARTLDALGLAYVSAGRARDATTAFDQALTIIRALVGDDNPLTGVAYNNLGLALLQTGEGERAARSFIRAVEILQLQEPVNLDLFAQVALNLGRMTELLDRPQTALELADNVLEIVAARPEGDVALTARVRAARASALFSLGRFGEAIDDVAIAWDIAQGDARLADVAAGLATIRARAEAGRGDIAAARQWFDEAARRAGLSFTRTDANRLAILYYFAMFEREAGRDLAAARTLLREAVGGSLARIESYDDFDAAAQREMRSLATLFRDQVAIAWAIEEAQ